MRIIRPAEGWTADAVGLVQRDSAWRRRAFGNVPFQPTPNFLKILNFSIYSEPPAVSKVMCVP